MKLFFILMISLITLSSHAGSEVRNGGGGYTENGSYKTFYSQNIPVEKSLKAVDIPSLQLTVQFVAQMPLSMQSKARLINALRLQESRTYYNIRKNAISQEEYQNLISTYREITRFPEQNLVLFALTDAQENSTYLFPEFFKLKATEQAAVLFHEALWLVSRNLEYKQVIKLEQAFQRYLENQKDPEAFYGFFSQLQTALAERTLLFAATIANDIQRGALPQNPLLTEILGTSLVDCLLGPRLSTLQHEEICARRAAAEEALDLNPQKPLHVRARQAYLQYGLIFLLAESRVAKQDLRDTRIRIGKNEENFSLNLHDSQGTLRGRASLH